MKITALEEYGLRCLLQLARAGKPLTISEVAKAEGLSSAYVGKLFFLMRRSKLVVSHRGAQGGYGLAQNPENMTLSKVLAALSTPKSTQGVCKQFPGIKKECVHVSKSCGVRSVWNRIYNNMWRVLDATTLADLLREEGELTRDLQRFEFKNDIPLTTTGGSSHVSA